MQPSQHEQPGQTQQQPLMDPYGQPYRGRGGTYSGSGGSVGGSSMGITGYPPQQHQQPPQHDQTRRYTLSAAPGEVSQPHGMPMSDASLMGNHSQRSHHSQQPQQPYNSMPSPSTQRGHGSNYEHHHAHVAQSQLSPSHLHHRMSLGFFPGSSVSPGNFASMMDPMDMSHRGSSAPPQASAAPSTTGGQPPATQAEREEELLLNLLIARRQRGRTGDKRSNTPSLHEELLRLRQTRAMRPQPVQQLPGMPPLYDPSAPAPTNLYHSDVYRGMDLPHHQRIDRSPGRFIDARMPMYATPSMDMEPMKKKRTHKRKPADMPRRPLSAYNLFFSEERERILKEIDRKDGVKEGTKEGEEGPKEPSDSEERKEEKPKALLRPMIPSQKKRRPHRKTHGKISFQELASMVGKRWKALDAGSRKYYQDLAQEDMKRQKIAMEEYYAKQNAKKDPGTHKQPSSGLESKSLENEPAV